MGVVKVIVNGTTKIDITPTTATASDVASLKTFFNRNGEQTSGTSGGGGSSTLITKTITANGTYNASSDDADGYSVVTASIPNAFVITDTLNSTGVEAMITASNGAGLSEPRKQVNFIDYDGTILCSYTAQEANALTALPANPSHSGLTAQGWNWTLAQIKAQLTAMPDAPVWVGQMYVTQSGDTEIDVSMPEGRLSPILTIAVNGTVTVDWGDNTSADTVTGSSLTIRQAPSHTYATPGDYTIVIHVVSGSFTFYCSSSYTILRKNTTANENRVYANCVQAVRLGSGITSVGSSAFYYCSGMKYITMPSGITSIGTNAFYYCCGMKYVTIPKDTAVDFTFQACYALRQVSLPYGITSLVQNLFSNCSSLKSVTIPAEVTSINAGSFNSCYGLSRVTIPSGVTSISSQAFQYAYGVAEYHIKPTTPPTFGTNVFAGIASDCVIYVPAAKLNDYQTAENWSAYASYMQGE